MKLLFKRPYWTHWVHVRYEIGRKGERAFLWIVWRLPRRLVYWAAIRVGAHATTGRYGSQVVPDLTFFEALERWDK